MKALIELYRLDVLSGPNIDPFSIVPTKLTLRKLPAEPKSTYISKFQKKVSELTE